MIYKGNNKCSRSPTSYRLISLANAIYKLYASSTSDYSGKSIRSSNPTSMGSDPTVLCLPLFFSFVVSQDFLNAILLLSTFFF